VVNAARLIRPLRTQKTGIDANGVFDLVSASPPFLGPFIPPLKFDEIVMRTRVHTSARPARCGAAAVIAVLLAAGCSQLDTSQIWPWSTAKAEKPEPGRMSVVWTHADQTEAGLPMRGLRGRIFFYPKEKTGAKNPPDKDPGPPMKVEGALTVYAFTVLADGKLSPTAPRKYFFNPEKLKKQFVESKQGPSYEVWLPWDGVGGPPKQISLRTRFDGLNQGAVVMSEPASQLLPGVSQVPDVSRIASGEKPIAPKSDVRAASVGGVEQAGYKSTDSGATNGTAAVTAAATADWWK
jgi:hypothetical protein